MRAAPCACLWAVLHAGLTVGFVPAAISLLPQRHCGAGRASMATGDRLRMSADTSGLDGCSSLGPEQQAATAQELETLRQKLWNPDVQADWENFYRTVREEKSYFASDIEGTIPADFAATIFRNGPGRFDRGTTRYEHVLDGDGHLIKFVVDGRSQSAHISNRYVNTEAFAAEEAAGSILFRSTFGTQPPGLASNMLNLQLKNQANTNIQFCGGRLLALWEAGLPYRIDPWTLATEGPDLLDGCIRGDPGALTVTTGIDIIDRAMGLGKAFTAHPHFDATSNKMVGFSWAQNPITQSLSLNLMEWDCDSNELAYSTEYVLNESSMAPHDFAVTESYYIFVVNQLEIDLLPYVTGLKGPAQCLSCTGQGNVLHLIPRPGGKAAGTKPLVVQTDDPWFAIHLSNAYEEGGEAREDKMEDSVPKKIVAFATGWDKVTEGPFLSDWGGDVPLYDSVPTTFLFRLEVDIERGTVTRQKCAGHCEHAHVHPHWEGDGDCRYIYAVAGNTVGAFSSPPCAWLRFDSQTGEQCLWHAGPRKFVEEPVLVPKHQAGRRGKEDTADAWLCGMLYDAGRDQSCLCILDAARLESGPVCKIWCHDPMPNGLHGCYSSTLFFPPDKPNTQ